MASILVPAAYSACQHGFVPSHDYWATIATVMPVLALATVVEARAITSNWNFRTPRTYRLISVGLWGTTLAILTFGTNAAIRALRDLPVADWWPAVCEMAISASMGLLVLSPTLELLMKANAEGFGRVLVVAFSPWLTLRWAWSRRASRRLLARWRRGIEKGQVIVADFAQMTERLEELLQHATTEDMPPELDTKLRAALERTRKHEQEARRVLEESIADYEDSKRRIQETNESLREMTTRSRDQISRQIMGLPPQEDEHGDPGGKDRN